MELSLIQKICIWALPVLFAITVHEVAHGWMAKRCGDKTAFMMGRLTLNPIKHIDPVGTILIPGILLSLGGFIFGWAKPVPVNPRNFKNPKRDTALVAAAGPISNFLMAFGWLFIAKLGTMFMASGQDLGLPMTLMGEAGVRINLILFLLNFLPIPPLDGSRIVSSFLPAQASEIYNKFEPWGFFILVLLMASGLLGAILSPLFSAFYQFMFSLINF